MASIFKRSNKGKLTYQVKYRVNEKAKSKTFPSAKLAREFKTKVEHELLSGSYVENGSMNISDFLDEWLIIHTPKVRAITTEGYKTWIKSIKGYIGNIPLQKIKATDIEKMYGAHSIDHSPRSVFALYQILRISFKHAYKARMMEKETSSRRIRPCKFSLFKAYSINTNGIR